MNLAHRTTRGLLFVTTSLLSTHFACSHLGNDKPTVGRDPTSIEADAKAGRIPARAFAANDQAKIAPTPVKPASRTMREQIDQVIRDASGHIIGRVIRLNNSSTIIYRDKTGRTVAQVIDGVTYDSHGHIRGRGDLGMMVLAEHNANSRH